MSDFLLRNWSVMTLVFIVYLRNSGICFLRNSLIRSFITFVYSFFTRYLLWSFSLSDISKLILTVIFDRNCNLVIWRYWWSIWQLLNTFPLFLFLFLHWFIGTSVCFLWDRLQASLRPSLLFAIVLNIVSTKWVLIGWTIGEQVISFLNLVTRPLEYLPLFFILQIIKSFLLIHLFFIVVCIYLLLIVFVSTCINYILIYVLRAYCLLYWRLLCLIVERNQQRLITNQILYLLYLVPIYCWLFLP